MRMILQHLDLAKVKRIISRDIYFDFLIKIFVEVPKLKLKIKNSISIWTEIFTYFN